MNDWTPNGPGLWSKHTETHAMNVATWTVDGRRVIAWTVDAKTGKHVAHGMERTRRAAQKAADRAAAGGR